MRPDLGYHPQDNEGVDLGYHPQNKSSAIERMFPVKNMMIIVYMWFIGWVVSFLVYTQKKDVLLKFHLNQALWIHILFHASLLLAVISATLAGFLLLATIALWFICETAILLGRDFKIPVLGDIELIK